MFWCSYSAIERIWFSFVIFDRKVTFLGIVVGGAKILGTYGLGMFVLADAVLMILFVELLALGVLAWCLLGKLFIEFVDELRAIFFI